MADLLRDEEIFDVAYASPLDDCKTGSGCIQMELEDEFKAQYEEPPNKDQELIVSARPARTHTPLTDAVIIRCVELYGKKWRKIVRMLGGPTRGWSEDVVRNRWGRISATKSGAPPEKKPRPAPQRPKRQSWTAGEDEKIRHLLSAKDKKSNWDSISLAFGNSRTKNAIRNRAMRLFIIY